MGGKGEAVCGKIALEELDGMTLVQGMKVIEGGKGDADCSLYE